MPSRTCDFCGSEIKEPLQWIQKKYKHHFCSSKCFHAWSGQQTRRRLIRTCLCCRATFEVIPGHIRTENQGNFCSLICWGKWQGLNYNPFKGKRHTGASKRLIGLASIKRKAWINLFTPEARRKHQKAITSPEYRSRMAERRARLNAQMLRPTKVELLLAELLNRHFPRVWEYTGDGKLIINNMIPDFANKNGKKALIELYGDYWHSEAKTRGSWRKTELGRIMAYNSLGYCCLVIWEHELKNEQAVVAKVKQFMKGELK